MYDRLSPILKERSYIVFNENANINTDRIIARSFYTILSNGFFSGKVDFDYFLTGYEDLDSIEDMVYIVLDENGVPKKYIKYKVIFENMYYNTIEENKVNIGLNIINSKNIFENIL